MHYLINLPDFIAASIPLFFYFLIRGYLYFADKNFGDCVTIFNFVKFTFSNY